MNKLLLVIMCVLVAAGAGAYHQNRRGGAEPVPRWEPVARAQFPIGLPSGERIDTGYLVVREDRARPAGRTIRLPVAIVRSRSASPAPDPVVYTAGGPGSSSLSAARYGGAYRFTETRDLIVFEQRGTRYAVPTLACPEVSAAGTEAALRSLSAAERARAAARAADTCRARLAASGVDPAAYSTAASAADLEDLRRVLGIAKWNLYGVSYSTRLMLTVLRDFPHGVRSAVLDSPLPPGIRYEAKSNANLARALQAVLSDCEAQPACRDAYPDLAARLAATLADADRSPVTLFVTAPTRDGTLGPDTLLKLRSADLVDLLDPGDTWSIPGLPRLMDQIARRDGTALRALVEKSLSGSKLALGMRYSVWCGEEAPFKPARKKPGNAGKKATLTEVLRGIDLSPTPGDICRNWRVPPVPKRYATPVRSNVPTLLLGGDYDPYSPPDWARAVSRTLPGSRVRVLRGMGHVPTQMWDQPCAMTLAAAFVESPNRDPAQSPVGGGCAEKHRPPIFETPSVDRPPGDGNASR